MLVVLTFQNASRIVNQFSFYKIWFSIFLINYFLALIMNGLRFAQEQLHLNTYARILIKKPYIQHSIYAYIFILSKVGGLAQYQSASVSAKPDKVTSRRRGIASIVCSRWQEKYIRLTLIGMWQLECRKCR